MKNYIRIHCREPFGVAISIYDNKIGYYTSYKNYYFKYANKSLKLYS